ncbi:MAG: hypothetical protein N2445_07045 [Acidobacteria bacterium]|nr:hypothetical protein [Acidobacteriota bacterium]
MPTAENSYELIENKLRYKFKNVFLLRQALTHSSYVYEKRMPKIAILAVPNDRNLFPMVS